MPSLGIGWGLGGIGVVVDCEGVDVDKIVERFFVVLVVFLFAKKSTEFQSVSARSVRNFSGSLRKIFSQKNVFFGITCRGPPWFKSPPSLGLSEISTYKSVFWGRYRVLSPNEGTHKLPAMLSIPDRAQD